MSGDSSSNPFRRGTIAIMVAVGFAAFVALLYGIGTGDKMSSGKNGEAHGASNSLVGYKALANLLEKTGTEVSYSRSQSAMDTTGLLILTPRAFADAEDIAKVMQDRSYLGPTMIILPKWFVQQAGQIPGVTAKKGWAVRLGLIGGNSGEKMLKDIADVKIRSVGAEAERAGKDAFPELEWDDNGRPVASDKGQERKAQEESRAAYPLEIARSAVGGRVTLPETHLTMTGDYIRNIVADPNGGGALIAYLDDGGIYPQLDMLDPSQISDEDEIDGDYFPLIIVADADLMNNGGMADKKVAAHALALVKAAGGDGNVVFDLTFNGLGSAKNLLTLAFEPPFLSATICFIIAGILAAWMAFNRFGPPLRQARSIDFGKTALVDNSAGFMKRMGREYLAAEGYGEMIRARAVAALGLPPSTDRAEANHKLDALGEHDGNRFTALLNNLNRADTAQDTAARAAALYNWKKEKIG